MTRTPTRVRESSFCTPRAKKKKKKKKSVSLLRVSDGSGDFFYVFSWLSDEHMRLLAKKKFLSSFALLSSSSLN